MKQLIYAILGVVICLFFSKTPAAQQQPAGCAAPSPSSSSGRYTTYINDQPFGTETYTLSDNPDGSRTSVADITFGGTKFKATTVVAQNRPVSFAIEMGGSRTITQEFTAQGVKLVAQGQPAREIKARPVALLENGVWHHFLFTFAQYDAARGGRQSFSAFLPSQALEFTLNVERVGAPAFDLGGQTAATEHYRVTTDLGLAFEMWTDRARVPLVVHIPAQKIKVVRQGAEELARVVFPPPAPKPAPSESDPFASEEVTFQNGAQKLAGTLTIPRAGRAPHPAAVIITGSGPQDRDGSALLNFYRLIAERLSKGGVAVLRVDDRGTGQSGMPTTPTGYRDLINDTRAAFSYLSSRREIDPQRIALVGHSEGAETALTLAAEEPRVAAVALLAGTSRPVDRVLVEQSLYAVALQAPVTPGDKSKLNVVARQLIEIFDEAKAQRVPADPSKDNLGWFREHAASDPLALARRVRVPVLILNGERDSNVLPYHALELGQALAEGGNSRVTLRIFPNLTHVFTPSQLDRGVTDAQAGEISTEFLQTLHTWATQVLVQSGAK
jgi:pimeloyl-ACP methyl ester carboxylesterase